jgi:hypothetical protein
MFPDSARNPIGLAIGVVRTATGYDGSTTLIHQTRP